MSTILFRSAELASGTGRTVYGIAVPYGQVAELIGWVQAAGLSRIAFVAQPAASAP